MKKRLIIYSVISLIALFMFLFIPELNIGGHRPIASIYNEIRNTSNVIPILVRLAVLVGVFIISLIFLFGLGKKESEEDED